MKFKGWKFSRRSFEPKIGARTICPKGQEPGIDGAGLSFRLQPEVQANAIFEPEIGIRIASPDKPGRRTDDADINLVTSRGLKWEIPI